MAFKKQEDNPGLELTGLIDIVFLLLIFFLVSFAFSLAGDVSASKIYSEMDLPKTDTELPVISEDWLQNLMIQVDPDSSEKQVLRRVTILWPSRKDSVRITRSQALYKAKTDSTFECFPAGFLSLPEERLQSVAACTLIANSIRRYVDSEKAKRRSARPIIEVRAEQNTEFKIINFIMEQCGKYDDLIPQIIIRTMP